MRNWFLWRILKNNVLRLKYLFGEKKMEKWYKIFLQWYLDLNMDEDHLLRLCSVFGSVWVYEKIDLKHFENLNTFIKIKISCMKVKN